MPKVSPIQTSFNGGEWSELVHGRVDSDRYRTAMLRCQNYVPTVQGSLLRRPGSAYVSDALDVRNPSRLIPFKFSNTQSYMIELGHGNQGRAFRNYQWTGTSFGHVYDQEDLADIKYTQSADVLYLFHPKYRVSKLKRVNDISFEFEQIVFTDGPYLPVNTTGTTLTPSAATGTGVTLTASSVNGINGGLGFGLLDLGRAIRIQQGTTWGWCTIATINSQTSVTVDIKATLTDTTAKVNWRLGLWSFRTGWPACGIFHEDRLFLAGSSAAPQRLDGSRTSGYEDFRPTDLDNVVKDNHAVSYNLNSDDIHTIQWLLSDEKGLIGGTAAGEWVVTPSTNGEALTPTNVKAKQVSRYGSRAIQPVQAGRAGLFVQTAGRKIREFTYFYDVQGFRAPDLSEASEHMTSPSIVQLAYQKEPQPLVWALRSDGALVSVTYRREDQGLIAAWARHELGGRSPLGTAPIIESIASIPNPAGTRDDLWMVVQRSVGGAEVRYVEVLNPYFDRSTEQAQAQLLDCSAVYDNPKPVEQLTGTTNLRVRSAAHGLDVGDKIRFSGIRRVDDRLNSMVLTVSSVIDPDLFEVVPGFTFVTALFLGGGSYRKLVSEITGLDHLNGETVTAYADGMEHANLVVSAGSISLPTPAAIVSVGYPFSSEGALLRIEAGAADGTALGKTRRIHRVRMLINRTLGLEIGSSFESMTEYIFRKPSNIMGNAVPLYSGLVEQAFDTGYDTENYICFRQNGPHPGTVLAVMAQMNTEDG